MPTKYLTEMRHNLDLTGFANHQRVQEVRWNAMVREARLQLYELDKLKETFILDGNFKKFVEERERYWLHQLVRVGQEREDWHKQSEFLTEYEKEQVAHYYRRHIVLEWVLRSVSVLLQCGCFVLALMMVVFLFK